MEEQINSLTDAIAKIDNLGKTLWMLGRTTEIKELLDLMIEADLDYYKASDLIPIREKFGSASLEGFFSKNELYLKYEEKYSEEGFNYRRVAIRFIEKELLQLDERRSKGLLRRILKKIWYHDGDKVAFYDSLNYYFSSLNTLFGAVSFLDKKPEGLSEKEDRLYNSINEAGTIIRPWVSIISKISQDYSLFFVLLYDLCEDFSIDLIALSKEIELDIEPFLDNDEDIKPNREFNLGPVKTNRATATTAQKWAILYNLMNLSTGWRLTDDENKLMYNKTDIAKFISFLCGGSEEFIRKRLEDEISTKEINEIIPILNNIGLNKIAENIKNVNTYVFGMSQHPSQLLF